ncbi:hypothetical protein [Inquilinus limosus]|uniref:hypothetical protein n=1 Tax=Inquilinus limosus TaxID=171674 RepID=UPI001C532869|nr:hypothetical protein [Inquilinus limosus]
MAIDDDVLAAAKGLAAQQRKTLGEVISDLARRSLSPRASGGKHRNGIPLLPAADSPVPVTFELVKQLQDDLPE